MTTDSTRQFDFSHWSKLANDDPERFEAERAEVIADLIDQAPSSVRRRMVGLQWQIDRLREKAPNPMAACVQMSRMMWDSVLGQGGLLETLDRLGRLDPRQLQAGDGATVLPFAPRADKDGASGTLAPGEDGEA